MRVSRWRGYRYSRIEQTRNRANRREQMRLNAMQCPANVGYSCVVVHKQTRGGNEALVVAGIIVEEHHVANSMDSIASGGLRSNGRRVSDLLRSKRHRCPHGIGNKWTILPAAD